MQLLYLVIVLSCIKRCNPQGHFVKDQHLNRHNFPPAIPKPSKGIPQGHLRPIGFQKLSDGRIRTIGGPPTPLQTYNTRCIEKGRPCLLRNHYHPEAEDLWADKYLSQNFKNHLATVYQKHGKATSETTLKMLEFLKKYHYDEWSLESYVSEKMKKDLTFPIFFQCPSQKEYFQEAIFRLSSGPVDSKITVEADHRLFCFLEGRGDFIISEPGYEYAFKMKDRPHQHSGTSASPIESTSVNMFEHKEVAEVPWLWATAYKGDCVFVPGGFIHQVKTFGRCPLVIFKTTPLPQYQNCNDTEANGGLLLNETSAMWVYNGVERKPNIQKWSFELVMKHIHSLIRNKPRLYIEQFTNFYNTVTKKPKSEVRDAWDAFKEFDNDLRGFITRKQLDSTPKHKFSWLTALLESRRTGVPMKDEL